MADIDLAYVKAELETVPLILRIPFLLLPHKHHHSSSVVITTLTLGTADPGNPDNNSAVQSKRFGTFGVRGAPGGDCFLRFSRERYHSLHSIFRCLSRSLVNQFLSLIRLAGRWHAEGRVTLDCLSS